MQIRLRDQPPIGKMTSGLRGLILQEMLAHATPDSIGPDQAEPLGQTTLLIDEADLPVRLLKCHDLAAQMQFNVLEPPQTIEQQRMQVAAVYGGIGRTVALQSPRSQGQSCQFTSIVNTSSHHRIRPRGYPLKGRLQAPGLQQTRGIGSQLQTRSDLRESRSLLEELHGPTGLPGSYCRRQGANATTRDQQRAHKSEEPGAFMVTSVARVRATTRFAESSPYLYSIYNP